MSIFYSANYSDCVLLNYKCVFIKHFFLKSETCKKDLFKIIFILNNKIILIEYGYLYFTMLCTMEFGAKGKNVKNIDFGIYLYFELAISLLSNDILHLFLDKEKF